MAAEYDSTEFIDTDFQAHKSPFATPTSASDPLRAPTREEVDRKVVEAQQKLAELKRAQDELERERPRWRNCAAGRWNFKTAARK